MWKRERTTISPVRASSRSIVTLETRWLVPQSGACDHACGWVTRFMRVRMKRVTHPHAWSQAPDWGTNHLVSNVTIEREDARTGEIVVRSRFHMMEFRRDATRHFAGSYIHHLRRAGDGFRIALQRVDMVNGQGTYDYVL